MGACGCRKREEATATPDFEESLIAPFEAELGWSAHGVIQLVKGLFEASVNHEISEDRLQAFMEKYAAKIDGFEDTERPLGKLYAEFRGRSGYMPEKLGLLMALLGKGDQQQRAEMIFLCYDLDHNEFLSQSEMEDLLTFLSDLATFHLPNYVSECLKLAKNEQAAEKLQNYIQLLGKNQQEAVNAWTRLLMDRKSNITALKFISTFASAESLSTTSTVRRFTYNPKQGQKTMDDSTSYGV